MAAGAPVLPAPRRGEIWTATLGNEEGAPQHWVVIVSLDARNLSGINSVLVVPFSQAGQEGPTAFSMPPGETGLPGVSWLKGHFITTIRKTQLGQKLHRSLSNARMRQLSLAIRRAYDPEAPVQEQTAAAPKPAPVVEVPSPKRKP